MKKNVDNEYSCAKCLGVVGKRWLVLVPQNDFGVCSMCNSRALTYHKKIVIGRKFEK